MAIPAGTRLGHFEVASLLGAGGMGEVYKARDTRLDRIVAIKVLPAHLADKPELRERFEREARTIASLNHPHICTLHDIGRQDGTDFLVMEYLEGETLATRLLKGPLPLDQVLQYAIEIADALDKAHRKGVTHRDIKPGNVMLTKSGTKLLDFGLAKLKQQAPAISVSQLPTLSQNPTAQGTLLGTMQYMAPEQLEGNVDQIDPRTDIFAFGAVVHEIATGKKAFEGKSHASLISAIMSSEPAPISSLQPMTPPALDRVVKTCLAKEPDERWQTAGDLCRELKWIAEGGSQAGMPAPTIWESKSSRRLGWAVALAALLGLAVLSFVHFREAFPQQVSMRFEVTLPENSAAQVFRVSPDGRYLVISVAEGGRSQLWLRPLNLIQAERLAGTDGATYPFWSPDSAYIGYFAQGKLKKIAVGGGPPQTLCDAPSARGGTWSRDGVILFAGLTSGIYRVSAAGGVPAILAQPTASPVENLQQRFPEFLPDGHHFTYLQLTADTETTGICIGSQDGTPPVRILPDASNAMYVPAAVPDGTGYLLFRRGTTLMAQPFDPARLQMTGEMFPVAEQVGVAANATFGAFSASDGGLLTYSTGAQTNRDLVFLDRAGKRLGVVGKPGAINQAALSPDEKTIAFSIGTYPTTDVWLQDLAHGVTSRFTFGPGSTSSPVWSPDGGRVAFSSLTNVSARNIYLKPANGTGKEELLKSGGINSLVLDWSPDGKFIVYEEFAGRTNSDLWLLPLEGDRKPVSYLQTPSNEMHGQFSPDGRWMAYVSDESGQNQIYVQRIPVNGSKWQASLAGGDNPKWRRDGKELFYLTADRKLIAVPVMASEMAFEAGVAQPLFEIEPGAGLYQPTADGKRFLMIVPAGGEAAAAPPITVVANWEAELRK